MRIVIGLALLGVVGWSVLPAAADDADRERIRALSGDVARLQAENKRLRTAQEQASAQLTRATQDVARLNRTIQSLQAQHQTDVVALQERLNKLAEEVQMRLDPAKVEAGRKELEERHTTELAAWRRVYEDMLVDVGAPAVDTVVALLVKDPVSWAPRLCPLLGRMGAHAKAALTALEAIAGDERHQRRGVARYAEEAIRKIRAPK